MEEVPFDGVAGSMPAPSSSLETHDAPSLEIGRPTQGRPRFTGRVGRALPGTIAGAFLVGAIVFGASAARPALSDTSSSQAAGGGAGAGGALAGNGSSNALGANRGSRQGGPDERGQGTGDGPGTEPTDGPGTEPAVGPGTEPTTKPDPTEKSDPTIKPNRESMRLVLSVTDGGAVKVDWTRCRADGAVAYKVVRTTDGGIRWPFGGADRLIAAIKDLSKTGLVDNDAPAGKTLVYRVFCVGGHDGAWTLLDSTPGRAIHVPGNEPKPKPKPEPTPTPQAMSLTLSNAATGGVFIDWSRCDSAGFYAYKVVRSPDEATSWPLGANDTLVTWIKDRNVTDFVDTSVEPGGHYFYRVFCVKATGDGYKVLNSTHVRPITVSAS